MDNFHPSARAPKSPLAFAATAIDGDGIESMFSNEISWVVPTNVPAPLDFSILMK